MNQPPNSFVSLDPADPDGTRISAPADDTGKVGARDAGDVQALAQADASLIHGVGYEPSP